jgi:hypothetical protein
MTRNQMIVSCLTLASVASVASAYYYYNYAFPKKDEEKK